MHTYLQQAQTRVVIHRTQVAKKKWKLRARFSPTKEDRVHQTKISTKTDKGGFSPAVFRSRLEQKTPSTEYLVYCVCVLFSMAKFMLRMSSVFVSVAKTFHSFAISAAKVPSVSALEFRCCRVIRRKNQLHHEAQWFFAEKSSGSFTASCSFPQRVQKQRLSSSSRSNGKRVSL